MSTTTEKWVFSCQAYGAGMEWDAGIFLNSSSPFKYFVFEQSRLLEAGWQHVVDIARDSHFWLYLFSVYNLPMPVNPLLPTKTSLVDLVMYSLKHLQASLSVARIVTYRLDL